jgi:uncharacterized membrane protein (UPF0127 family)
VFGAAGARAAVQPLEIVTKSGVQVFGEMATTEEEDAGLMYRGVAGRTRMRSFSPEQVSMWMKNTFISST